MNTQGTDGTDPPKKPAKTTFPKERLYQLQKNYRERKKERVKKLESDLEEANREIDAGKVALAAARDEILQLKHTVASFRMKFEVASDELKETRHALNLLRETNSIEVTYFSVNSV